MYTGEQNTEALPQYEIAEFPDGYIEIDRDSAPGLVSVTYENAQGDPIYFNYAFLHQGTLSGFYVEDADAFEVRVNNQKGTYFAAQTPGNINTLTWIDADENLQFTIDGCCQYDVLLRMAESISLCKTLN